MPFAAVLTIPTTAGNHVKLKGLIAFLEGTTTGEYTFLWECAVSKQLVGIRVERFADSSIFPMSLEVIAPKIPCLPFFCHHLTSDDVQELITVCKLELTRKWEKHVTFSS